MMRTVLRFLCVLTLAAPLWAQIDRATISGAITDQSGAIVAGAALYINVVEHPARMECGTELAVRVFGPSYKRAAVMQAALAVIATACGVASWLLGGSVLWMAGAVLIFLVIPFTLIVIFPTNKELLASGSGHTSANTHQLLVRWGKLHAVRTVLSLTATVVFLVATHGTT